MKNIVKVENSELVVTISDISKFSGNNEKSVKRLLVDNEDKFELLGLKVKSSKAILNRLSELKLNEEQTTFLFVLMRNTPQVLDFKFNLVRQFMALKDMVCETNKIQLEDLRKQNKVLRIKKMKTYKDGFVSLRKYLKENEIPLSEETALSILISKSVVEKRDVIASKSFLLDDAFGRQYGDSSIEFNSRSLDLVFGGFIVSIPSLFD